MDNLLAPYRAYPKVVRHVKGCKLCREHDKAVAGLPAPSRATGEEFRRHIEATIAMLRRDQ